LVFIIRVLGILVCIFIYDVSNPSTYQRLTAVNTGVP
jgi:hypothetical protein